ncbi:MAG TPA: DNA polymerase III subunit gamma/tau [Planctomycetes bacterium]|nr:DNA polymerase III subunit gamma/tau [Planctomycetota bacterium]
MPAGSRSLGEYVVVARRYRPQRFEELIGQEHVARALSSAIQTDRVGHAYLFTGARGVGKTSAARILSKALNCVEGPSPTPCNRCDICGSIAGGEDVDVLEIDGASNRGIDEIRQLRQNVNVRPSRARFKIYIIDEVHMLTREAFNALLKTLEEPPEHVKFIFCTTEPGKIPVTILSRCQRFDFGGIDTAAIAQRLAEIVQAEGFEAEPEALQVLARRATGSMRDAQSLLEQLLAFAPQRITVADVHHMLGTAGEERLGRIVDRVVDGDAAGALAELDAAIAEGVEPAQLLEQLFGYLRDCMAAVAGCPPELFLFAAPHGRDQVVAVGRRWGMETILAAMQILDHTLSRLRFSTQGRVLAELALVRLCTLEALDELSDLISRLQAGAPSGSAPAAGPRGEAQAAPPPASQNRAVSPAAQREGDSAPVDDRPTASLNEQNALDLWNQTLSAVSGIAAEHGRHYERVTFQPPNRLVVWFKPEYNVGKSYCERPEQTAKFNATLRKLTGQEVRVEFALVERPATEVSPSASPPPPQQRLREICQHPMVRRASELFGAHPIRVDPPSRK